LEIVLSNSSGLPLYEQIASQIKNMIISGELKSGEALPSMRYLAKELRISVITTKRAYEELEREGFITTVQGKGSFVSEKNMEIIREEQLRVAEEHLEVAVRAGKQAGISLEELITVLEMFYREGE
jgi:GntR family transcriptional regulator